jgi:hypothetical protein
MSTAHLPTQKGPDVASVSLKHFGARFTIVLCGGLLMALSEFLYLQIADDIVLAYTSWMPTIPYEKWIVIVVLALVPLFFLPLRISLPSQTVVWILYISVYVPTLQFGIPLRDIPMFDFGEMLLVMNASLLSLSLLSRRRPKPLISGDLAPPGTSTALMVGWSVLTIALSILITGSLVNVRSYETIYDTRAEYAELVSNAGSLLGYLIPPSTTVIAPLLIAWGVIGRRRSLTAIGLFVAVFIALQTGGRSSLLGPALALVAAIALSRTRARSYISPIFLLAFFGMSAVLAFILDHIFTIGDAAWSFSELMFFRALVAPGEISSVYFDFFSLYPHTYWSYSAGGGLLSAILGTDSGIYSLPPSRIIGEIFFWGSETNANANPWFNGFAEAGTPGAIFESVLMLLYFYFLDRVAVARKPIIVAVASLPVGFALANVGITVALLTNGLALFVLIVALTTRQEMNATSPGPLFHRAGR